MDFPSKNMYDTFKDEIWKELGPLDPDWFETLTAQTFGNDENVSDQDDLCAHQEAIFKTPFDKSALDSQLFSTPKVFRQRRIVSPEAENEQSFTAEQETQKLSWAATQSPCLFQTSKEGIPGTQHGSVQPHTLNSFGLLQTPQKSPTSYAKQISESLGAQIYPDISWTSSLNTPPGAPSTLILTKADESPCPESISADKNVVLVRKLFPSLSNASGVGVMSPENTDKPAVQSFCSPKTAQNPESPKSQLNEIDGVWRQNVRDATEDGETCSAIADVPDGVEHVPSMFLTNSSSSLRKVKSDRTKRKQITPTEEPADISATNNSASREQGTANQEPGEPLSSPPIKAGDNGITQWSPLSLSEIPSCTATCHDNSTATRVKNSVLTEQKDSDSGAQVRASLNVTDSGFTKKKRRFIYTVKTPKQPEMKEQHQEKETQSQVVVSSHKIPDSGQDVSVKELGKAPDEANCSSTEMNLLPKQENLPKENLPPPVQAEVHDLDMSQLCRDFAQDFSDMSDPGQLNKEEEDLPREVFSPSACLSAMKQAEQRARQTNIHHDCDGFTNRGHISATVQPNPINEVTVSDSGFQSAVTDISHMTASSFVVPSSENNGQTQQWSCFKTDRSTTSLSTEKGDRKVHLDNILREAGAYASLSRQRDETVCPGREDELHIESTSMLLPSRAKRTVNNIDCMPLNRQIRGCLPEKTLLPPPSIYASGFKTASNKGIQISSANLQRAKCLFEETEGTFSDQMTNCAHETKNETRLSHGSVKKSASYSNQPPSSDEKLADRSNQLTASQRADVSELCTLLEEADSQFDLTPLKTAKIKQDCEDNTTSPHKVDKDLEPDFLAGIDFDDSFSLDPVKHQAASAMHDKIAPVSEGERGCETSNITGKSTSLSLSLQIMEEKSPGADGSSVTSAKLTNLDTETNKLKDNNTLMLGVGFKTAGGNVLRVSKKYLSKARALFADLEESQNPPAKLNSDTDAKVKLKQSGDNLTGNVLNHEKEKDNARFTSYGNDPCGRIQECISNKKETLCSGEKIDDIRDKDATRSFTNNNMDTNSFLGGFQMASAKRVSVSAKAMQEADALFKDCDTIDCNAGMSAKPRKNIDPSSGGVKSLGHKDSPALTNTAALLSAQTLSSLSPKNIGSSDVDELSAFGGFCTARGEKVIVSAEGMKKAERLLTEDHTPSKQVKEKDNSRTVNQTQVTMPSNGGFHTASGKGVAVSSAALKKAKTLFNDCDEIENNGAKPTHSKVQVPQTAPRRGGFLAASGKQVAFSAEALQKAKALFSDISERNPSVSDTRNQNKEDKIEDAEKVHCGFSTAGGARVHVSKKNLQRAKNLLKDFEDDPISAKEMQEVDEFFNDCEVTDNNNASSKEYKSITPLSESDKKKTNLTENNGRMAANISEKSGNGWARPVNVKQATDLEKKGPLDSVELNKGCHKNALDSANGPSLHGNPALMTKPLSSPLCTTSKNSGFSAINELSTADGFCTASGKKVFVSDDALTKAKSLLHESATCEETNQLDQKEDIVPPQNGGFQTASGRGVVISSAALKKAKSLLNDRDEVEDKSEKPTHFKMPYPGQPPRSGRFLSAGGKRVAFSSQALKKAKALFSDMEFTAEKSAGSDSQTSDKKGSESVEKIHFGFTTAGGAKVHVLEKNLLKAKNLFEEIADEDLHYSKSTGQNDCHKSELPKVEDLKRASCLTTARYRETPTEVGGHQVDKTSTLQKTEHKNKTLHHSSLTSSKCATNASESKKEDMSPSSVCNLHDSLSEEMFSMLDQEMNAIKSNEGSKTERTDEQSLLVLESFNLSGCTETQQKLLAQEALDCTKALLEDESLAGQSLSGTEENVEPEDNQKPSSRSAEEHKGKGKRPIEDSDITGQPPLKRRLLEEFNGAVDGSKVSSLNPEISSPAGLMKDRRAFKYRDCLQPNITTPLRNEKQYMESRLQKKASTQHSAPEGGRSTFVPPFLKNVKTESRKNAALKDDIRTPPAFVPPFKKQRTIVQESSSKPQKEGDKHCSVSVMPANSSAYIPPTKKTQSSAERTANESKENNQMLALEESTNDNQINNQKLLVGCASENSAAETSHAEAMSGSQEMLQNLHNIELAQDMQDMRIRKKKRQTIRPLPGSLFLTKTSGVPRIKLRAEMKGKPPGRYTKKQLYESGVHQHVCEITGETAESFCFRLQHFIKQEAFIDGGGIQLADGGWLIPSNDGTAGKQEFYRALLDSPGVDPKLISEEWVYNHYRWIVWKQASMERSFPETMGGLCLTPEQVLLQLKYRYDVEVDHSCRPALRKIMEKDDTSAKTLVLCVCGVVSGGHSRRQNFSDAKMPQGGDTKLQTPCAVVWLTDGWYSIKAQLDEPLTAMFHKGRLAVGGKLIIHGAQLVGSQDACSPLEAPESLMLKVCANSSRPARWDTKLGFHRDPRPFLLPVSSLYCNGGPVGCVDIIILRSYPIQWMERKPDGGVVFRSDRAEEKEARRFNSNKQKAMEILFAKIQADFENEEKGKSKPRRRRRTISRQGIASLQDGEELYEAVEEDPAYLEAHLSDQQLETLHAYKRSLMERKQAELQDRYRRALENAENSEGSCPKRDVTPVWRLCFADSVGQTGSIYQLNLWRPTSDHQSLLKEGCRYKVYNLTPSEGKKLGGNTGVQLTGTKKTQFQDLQSSPDWLSARFQPRVSTHFVDLQNPEYHPLCGEVDLTGFVISVIDGQGSSPAFYLADGKLDIVKVRCFSSFAQSGLEDLVKPRILLALSNLQLRGQSTHPMPVVYAGDLTAFSTNPKEVHLKESISQIRHLVQPCIHEPRPLLQTEDKAQRQMWLCSIKSEVLGPSHPSAGTLLHQTVRQRRTPPV
ncbi:breast cancer type 2 susceptibility protein isoform X2 [Cheilinus undulatus]|uniref:breast cancer type 2 susceptibility protein isoform X2 n=1 Tax=Cheilinus undulatus TaxID=241271 RepID=UPI001BD3E0B8|nr:breast cancer type 2 susceptibility protein isoform X2 [Cheilinus undulatus]